jgi:glycosyltransferase involved in cell wall biosynthesis
MQVAVPLRLQGWESVVAMPSGEDSTFSAMLTEAGIPCVQFDLVRFRHPAGFLTHWNFVRRFWPNVRRLRQMIRDTDIDVVHANGIINLQGPIAARMEGVPLVWHLNEIGSPRLLQVLFGPLVRRWSSVIAVSSNAVSQHYFRSAVARVEDRIRVLYPPVDPRRCTGGNGDRVRRELGIPDSAPVVGMMGHLNPLKGVEFLIGAMPAIKAAFPSATLLIVGSELATQRDYGASLRRLSRVSGYDGDILFVGARSDVADVLSSMSVYVQASLSESFGMATAEASAAGLPVVATDVGGAGEVVAAGISGLLVEPGSATAIAEGVVALLKDVDARRAMGVEGAHRCRELFSVQRSVNAHIAAYEAAVAGGGGGHEVRHGGARTRAQLPSPRPSPLPSPRAARSGLRRSHRYTVKER